jgi:protein KRI1
MDKYGNDFASELNKSTRKRLNIEDNGSEEEEDSESDEEEDEEGELVTPEVDAQIMKTIAMIREKNPLVYDSTVQHFSGMFVCRIHSL